MSSPPSSPLRCPPPPPVHANNNNNTAAAIPNNTADGKAANPTVVPPKPRARPSKMGVSSLESNNATNNAANNKPPPHVHVAVQGAWPRLK